MLMDFNEKYYKSTKAYSARYKVYQNLYLGIHSHVFQRIISTDRENGDDGHERDAPARYAVDICL